MEKYQYLARKTGRLWKTSVNVIPIVAKALETVASLDKYTSMPDIEKREVDRVKLSVLLGSTRILRNVLDISGLGL